MPKVESKYTCLAVILIDRVLKNDENYSLQLVLKNVSTLIKKRVMIRYITNDLQNFSGKK